MYRLFIAGFMAASLFGCAGSMDLHKLSSGTAFRLETLKTPEYTLQAMVPPPGAYKHLRVYIEGDGHAWATSSQPSTDPTPHTSLMASFAAADPTPAAYLARPCQFVMSPSCSVSTWTSDRFSSNVMASMDAALDALKREFGVEQFELVGHSGGGAVALVLAGMRDDVSQVQTLAGNVDPVYWTELNNLSALNNPITPLQYKERLKTIPQRLFVGSRDLIVPPAVSSEYVSKLCGKCIEISSINADHQNGYQAAWLSIASQPVECKEN
ncbi:alpha/beta fold hydrolase [Pseudomonas sp. NPDC089569]|uniref:alpha/beta fold hydrolase n=1 Tax=Pseudomonas sp. NPDC089569 TaxID=3390722 RepID=UPI003D06D2AA